ncbi:MAG TPA: hypothetical protein EYP03_00665 [Aquificae bacterium]|nr:hypothetical protein [Aquificota bacterium]
MDKFKIINSILYGFSAALLFAFSGLIDKLVSNKFKTYSNYGILKVFFNILILLCLCFIFNQLKIPNLNIFLLKLIFFAFFIFGNGYILYLYLLQKEKLSLVSPIFSSAIIFLLLIDIIFYKVKYPLYIYLFILITFICIFLLSLEDIKHLKINKNATLALLVAFDFAYYPFVINEFQRVGNPKFLSILMGETITFCSILLFYFLYKKILNVAFINIEFKDILKKAKTKNILFIFFSSLALILGAYLELIGYKKGYFSLTSTFASLATPILVGISFIFLKEKLKFHQYVALIVLIFNLIILKFFI